MGSHDHQNVAVGFERRCDGWEQCFGGALSAVGSKEQRLDEMEDGRHAHSQYIPVSVVALMGQVRSPPQTGTNSANGRSWPFILHWTWTAQVFFTLHTLVILMKMHSYAFYNGHLSNTQQRLRALDDPGTADIAAAVRYPSSSTGLEDINAAAEKRKASDDAQNLTQLRTDLATELVSPLGSVTYPSNLSMANYADFICCPTLCYELEYPRTPKTQWMELFYKTLAVFGCIFLLTLTSEEFIVPVLRDSALRLQAIDSWFEMGLILAESISELLFPFMVTLLLVFLVIFEYVLGAFAEITCFADRHFYSDWWNSCDW